MKLSEIPDCAKKLLRVVYIEAICEGLIVNGDMCKTVMMRKKKEFTEDAIEAADPFCEVVNVNPCGTDVAYSVRLNPRGVRVCIALFGR